MTIVTDHTPCPMLPAVENCDTTVPPHSPRAFFAAPPASHEAFRDIAIQAGATFTTEMAIADLRWWEDTIRMRRTVVGEDGPRAYMPPIDQLVREWRWKRHKVLAFVADRGGWLDHAHAANPAPCRPRRGGRRLKPSTENDCGPTVARLWADCHGMVEPGFYCAPQLSSDCGPTVARLQSDCLAGAGFAHAHNSQPHRAQEHTPCSSGVVSPPSVHEPPAPEPPPPPAPPPADPSPHEPEPEVSSDAGSATGGEALGGAWSGRRVVRSWEAAYQQVHGVPGPLGRRGRGIAKTLAGKLNARLNPPTAAQLVAGMVDYLQHQAAGRAFPWLKDEPHATRPAIGHFAGDENLSRFFPDNPPAWTGQEWDWTNQDGAGEPEPDPDPPAVVWTPEALAMRERVLELVRRQREAGGEPQGMAAK